MKHPLTKRGDDPVRIGVRINTGVVLAGADLDGRPLVLPDGARNLVLAGSLSYNVDL